MLKNLETHNVQRETFDAFLRLSGRAFATGNQKLHNAAFALLPWSFSVAEYCNEVVQEQIALRDRTFELTAK